MAVVAHPTIPLALPHDDLSPQDILSHLIYVGRVAHQSGNL